MKVAVGMSGGVDSSVSALLLKEKGYNVIGITLKLSSVEDCNLETQVCCSPQDVKDAKKVATFLGIEHYTIDWERLFKQKVIKPFIDAYKIALTPNPCSICNREVKTERLLRYVKEVLEVDKLATGHYIKKEKIKDYELLSRGADSKKDQSYFLALVSAEVIPYLEFPLGNLKKEEVREVAKKYNLPVFEKKDSFEICFTLGKSPAEYIEENRFFNIEEGDIIHLSGKKLGKHKGLIHYTIGQRRGIGVSYGKPLYVVDKDFEKNILIVGEKEDLLTDTVKAKNFNFHLPIEFWEGNLFVQGRYKQKPIKVRDFSFKDNILTVKFEEKAPKFASGQILAVYKDDILLGGGIII
ncbi:MAG: tRNA 2-thiouridine(34) synthase MnmA [Hydrogenothermus sp.]|nr:MAG: tRNA 2-thiouridine(34) synthase MnmA [Hydrogenothermus sp.]